MLDESEKRDRKSRKRISRSDSTKRLTKMKVYGISDLHADFEENLAWLRELPETEYKNDVLCVAGDVSEHMEILEIVWKILVPRFHRVFFVVGNHDLWTSLEHKVIFQKRKPSSRRTVQTPRFVVWKSCLTKRVVSMSGFDLEVQSDQRAVQSARRSHGAGAGRRAGLDCAAAVVVLRHGREGQNILTQK